MFQYVIAPFANAEIQWHNTKHSPSVYLDHWAIMDISCNEEYCRRFTDALIGQKGTLCISIMNIREFADVSDRGQQEAAERFVDGLLPHIYFLTPNFVQVTDGEKQKHSNADCETKMAERFAQVAAIRGGMSVGHLFSELNRHHRNFYAELSKQSQSLTLTIIRNMGRLLFSSGAKPSELNKLIREAAANSLTEGFLLAAYEHYQKNITLKLTPNSVDDFLHLIVPATRCDYVLLDGPTCSIVEAVRRRLAGLGYTKIAKAYSKRRGGLGEFLDDFCGKLPPAEN